MSEQSEFTVNCPQCHKPVVWNEKAMFRPFCSKRCQLIDLGEWASEEKSIPGDMVDVAQEQDDSEYR